jgi:sugar lactone lactonase YvrE
VQPISSNFTSADDFVLDKHGNAWITTDPNNSLLKVTPDGTVTAIEGAINETTLLGPTSAAFGRTSHDLNILYITSNGGIGNPPLSGIGYDYYGNTFVRHARS